MYRCTQHRHRNCRNLTCQREQEQHQRRPRNGHAHSSAEQHTSELGDNNNPTNTN